MNDTLPLVSFGAVADLQYCDADPEFNRYFRNAPQKLSDAINVFNQRDLDFVINLGDTIDKAWKSFDGILSYFRATRSQVYHVLGNHDYEVEDEFKSMVHERIDIKKYYDFSIKNWRFIVLDGNEISTYANTEDSENYFTAKEYLNQNKINSNFWNGAIGRDQISWFSGKIEESNTQNENVIVFCHFPIYPGHRHNLLNDTEILDLISRYDCVKAWICGHNHDGNYGELYDIHFINLMGMVDHETETAFSMFHLFNDHMKIEGFGNEISAKLHF